MKAEMRRGLCEGVCSDMKEQISPCLFSSPTWCRRDESEHEAPSLYSSLHIISPHMLLRVPCVPSWPFSPSTLLPLISIVISMSKWNTLVSCCSHLEHQMRIIRNNTLWQSGRHALRCSRGWWFVVSKRPKVFFNENWCLWMTETTGDATKLQNRIWKDQFTPKLQ